MDAEIRAGMAQIFGKNAKYFFGIDDIAGYEKPKTERTGFDAFHKFITEPTPAFIANWRSNTKDEQRYYSRLVGGVLGHTYSAYLAVNYHYDRLTEIEDRLIALFADYDFASMPQGTTIGMGNTVRWDFEYQSFVLSYRRCLDYFTYGLNSYFKDSANSFRDWGKHLSRHKPEHVAKALLEVYDKHRANFHFVMNVDPAVKSVRDRITHNEAVSAGCINVTQNGIIIAGGGEGLGFFGNNLGKTLSQVLQGRIVNLREYLNESLFAWIAAVDPNELR